jgi:hypothetical protein
MRLKPALGFVVGEATPNRWSQVLTTPNAYAVIEVTDQDGVARNHGVRVMAKLTHALEMPPLSLKDIEKIVTGVVDENVETVILVVPVGKVVYIALAGTGSVFIKRGGMYATLLSKPGGISGEVKVGDTLVFASGSIVRSLTREEIADSFDHLTASDAAEKLTLTLHQKTDNRAGAALIFQVAGFLEEELPVTEIEENDELAASLIISRSVIERIRNRVSARRYPTVRGTFRRLRHFTTNHKYLKLALVTGCALIFTASVILGSVKRISDSETQKLESVYQEVKSGLDEGLALMALNPVKSRERLKVALDALLPYDNVIKTKSKEGLRLAALKKDVEDAYQAVYKRYEVTPEVFYDASLLRKDAKIQSLGLFEDTLVLLDVNGTSAYAVDVLTRRGEIIGGGSAVNGAKLIAAGSQAAYILSENGVFQIGFAGSQPKQPVISRDNNWGNIGSLVYYGDNLYLLDTINSRIWKYTPAQKGFSERKEYLNPDTLPDFSQATGMAIDGSVWIGGEGGTIRKFTSGQDATFVVSGVDPALAGAVYVFTDDKTGNLYVTDTAAGNRIVVMTKDGVYSAQYIWKESLPASRFVVSESAKRLLMLSGGVIYSITLK